MFKSEYGLYLAHHPIWKQAYNTWFFCKGSVMWQSICKILGDPWKCLELNTKVDIRKYCKYISMGQCWSPKAFPLLDIFRISSFPGYYQRNLGHSISFHGAHCLLVDPFECTFCKTTISPQPSLLKTNTSFSRSNTESLHR